MVRMENGASEVAEVTVAVTTSQEASTDVSDETPAERSVADTIIRVPSGSSATGRLPCGELLSVTASVGETNASLVGLVGDGTGTLGFDSGTVGLGGERYLEVGTHLGCTDTIVIQVLSRTDGRITVVAPGESLPESVSPPTGTEDSETPDAATGGGGRLTFRLENATATAADMTLTPGTTGEDEAPPATVGPVRVPAGQFTTGDVACGQTYTVTAAMSDSSSSAVLFTGDGTGTEGFDGASIGLSGERLLVFGTHYACGETIVVRITDDGSGIGVSTSEAPIGEVNVFAVADTVPEPDLPDPDELADEPVVEEVELVIVNAVESTIQVNFGTGSGSLAGSDGVEVSSEFDVRVPPGQTSRGSAACAQEYIIAAAHLQATGTTPTETSDTSLFGGGGSVTFHSVVLTGDGTGTEGFDSSSIAVVRGRLLQLGEHFECGDTITIMVTATNNQVKLDDEGMPVADEYGNPTIQYGVGEGSVTVTSGG